MGILRRKLSARIGSRPTHRPTSSLGRCLPRQPRGPTPNRWFTALQCLSARKNSQSSPSFPPTNAPLVTPLLMLPPVFACLFASSSPHVDLDMLAASALVRMAGPTMAPSSALQRQRSLGSTLGRPAAVPRGQPISVGLHPARRVAGRRAAQPTAAQRHEGGAGPARAASAELVRLPSASFTALCHFLSRRTAAAAAKMAAGQPCRL